MAMSKQEKTDYKRKFNEEKYDRVGLYLKQGEKERWQAAADLQEISLSEFIKRCVNNSIEYDKEEAKKPYITINFYACPRCGSYRSIRQKHDYCHDCGQKLDWSEK